MSLFIKVLRTGVGATLSLSVSVLSLGISHLASRLIHHNLSAACFPLLFIFALQSDRGLALLITETLHRRCAEHVAASR